jgi:hypothetical protein
MNTNFSTLPFDKKIRSFEWINLKVEKLRSEAALDVAMVK